jgi:Rod binding domain-containing protein
MDVQPANLAALARAAKRFEAQALGSLLQPVFGEGPKGLLSGGAAEAQWRPMLVENYARAWSDRGGVGIADAVLRELVRVQAAAQNPQAQNPQGQNPQAQNAGTQNPGAQGPAMQNPAAQNEEVQNSDVPGTAVNPILSNPSHTVPEGATP